LSRLLLAGLHLFALGIGLGAVWGRGRALRGPLDPAGLRRVFYADNWWGLAAVLWIGTGLLRLLMSTEKPTAYYLQNHLFWTKMALLGLIVVLEIMPMVTLIRWRIQLRKGQQPDTSRAGRLVTICCVQAAIVIAMIFVATAMARGYGSRGASSVGAGDLESRGTDAHFRIV
jgi:putative membrane protein